VRRTTIVIFANRVHISKKEKRKSGRMKGKNPCVKEARSANLVKMEMLDIFFVHCYIRRWK
jgi:hypothetical protein